MTRHGDLDHEVLIVLARPELGSTTRSSQYSDSRRRTEVLKQRMLAELERCGLSDEAELGPTTGFSLVIARLTDRAAECLRSIDGVDRIVPITDEQEIELLGDHT